MKHWVLVFAAIGSLSAALAQTGEVSGYWKAMPSRTVIPLLGGEPMSQAYLHQRTNFKWRSNDRKWQVRVEARSRFFFGSQVERTPGMMEGLTVDAGLWDGSWNWLEAENGRAVGNTLLDRAVVGYRAGRWRVDIGRQRINWGKHTIWNPNDLFNAYNFLDFDYVERPGTDAARVRCAVGGNGMNELDVAIRPGTAERAPLAAGLFRWNMRGIDGQVLAARTEHAWAAGGACSAGWGPFSFKSEATYFGASASWGDSAIWSGTLGIESTWGQGGLGQVAVLRSPGLGGVLFDTQNQQQPWSLLPFGWTIMGQIQVPLSERMRLGNAVLFAPEDHVLIGVPTLFWDAATNWTAAAVIQSMWSRSPFLVDGPMEQSVTSVYLSLQWNFKRKLKQ